MVWIPVRIEYFRIFPIERAVVKPVNWNVNRCSSWNGHAFNCGGLLTVSIKSINETMVLKSIESAQAFRNLVFAPILSLSCLDYHTLHTQLAIMVIVVS